MKRMLIILSLGLFSSMSLGQSLDIANPTPYEEVDYKKIMEELKIRGYIYYLKHASAQLPLERQKELVDVAPSQLEDILNQELTDEQREKSKIAAHNWYQEQLIEFLPQKAKRYGKMIATLSAEEKAKLKADALAEELYIKNRLEAEKKQADSANN